MSPAHDYSLALPHTPLVLATVLLYSVSVAAHNCHQLRDSEITDHFVNTAYLKPLFDNGTHLAFRLETQEAPGDLGHSTFLVEVGQPAGSMGRLTIKPSDGITGRPCFFIYGEGESGPGTNANRMAFWLNPNDSCDFKLRTNFIAKSAAIAKVP